MGRTESAKLNLGIRIQIKDLLEVIDEDNFSEIRNRFFEGESLIDDQNGFYHDTFEQISWGNGPRKSDRIDLDKLNHEEYKKHMSKMFKSYGDYYEDLFNELDDLNHQYLLVSFNSLTETTRYGHNREGSNGASCVANLVELENNRICIKDYMKKMKIEKYTITFNIFQYGG